MLDTLSKISHRYVTNKADGTRLFVVEAGNPEGRPILFIHGINQSWLCWLNQLLDKELSNIYRLVAFDVRGHGQSDKPESPEAYANSQIFADDINTIMETLNLTDCILVGWSWAGFLICDYIRHYGQVHVSGINLVGACTKIIQTRPEVQATIIGSEAVALLPSFFTGDLSDALDGIAQFVRLCTYKPLPTADFYRILGYNLAVPAYVRQNYFGTRPEVDNDDVLAQLTVPVLITHGLEDKVVMVKAAYDHSRIIPHSHISYYRSVGHSTFLEQPNRFNQELLEFACWTAISSSDYEPSYPLSFAKVAITAALLETLVS